MTDWPVKREKACHFKAFFHKTQAGIWDSPGKLFNTPACVQNIYALYVFALVFNEEPK